LIFPRLRFTVSGLSFRRTIAQSTGHGAGMKMTRREAVMAVSAPALSAASSHAVAQSPQAETKLKKSTNTATGVAGLEDVVSISDMEAIAHARMEHMAWEYISGGAGDEITLRWNREAFDKIRLDTRVLRDVSNVDTKTSLLGIDLLFPVMLAPTALHKLAHPEGELATAKGAGDAGTAMVLSTMSSTSLEDVAKVATSPPWFQLYVQKDKGFTKELVERAVAAGYKALVVTVDTPTDGARNRQERAKFHLPPGVEMSNLKGLKLESGAKVGTERHVFDSILPHQLTWKDIEWLQSLSKLPVVAKGVLNANDAEIAAKQGLGAVQVSNHGARQLDTTPATIDALPRIADKVGGRIPLILDGGVRRGTDVLKALANGANVVMVGRPIFYGLSTAGAAGVTKALNILRHEFEMSMALTGVTTIKEIDRSVLWS
jgi:4-hydroxymandelate oxidase